MKQSTNFCKILHWTCFFLLSFLNVLLTTRLLHIEKCSWDANSALKKIPKIPPLTSLICSEYKEVENFREDFMPAFHKINLDIGRWDSQRLYKYYDFACIGNEFDLVSKTHAVCLATQSSMERLQPLVQVARHWNGPISLALFIAGDEEFNAIQLYVTYLRYCFPFIRNYVSFHLAVPRDKQPKKIKNSALNWDYYNCASPELTLKEILKLRSMEIVKWRLKNSYPQNHLRNLARKGCQSDHVFLTDIDIIPSNGITNYLNEFLKTHKCKRKCAYVVPTYEIGMRLKYPKSKEELIRLVKKGLARPFHQKVFVYNQYATNFTRWQLDMNDTIHISHNVTNFEFLYEPFYVVSDSAPQHDERFLGYGFTRNTQVYEMFVAGYQFQVLSPIFACHWGLQSKKTRPAWREQQNNINRKLFEKFKKEILVKHKINV